MNMNKSQCQQNKEGLCKTCHLFYGAQAYHGLCSSCFKKEVTVKKEEMPIKTESKEIEPSLASRKDTCDTVEQVVCAPVQKDRKRCFDCNKKIGLLGNECKCGFVYCNSHRLPQEHHCIFDFAGDGKKKLQKQIVKVYNGKINQI